MEEERGMEQENLEKKKRIEDRVIELYGGIQGDGAENDSKEKVENITHYRELQVVPIGKEGAGGINLENPYVVRVVDEKERVLHEIYDDNMLIATMDEGGTITFSMEYKQMFMGVENGQLLVNELEELEGKKVEIREPELEKGGLSRSTYSPKKIAEMKENRAKAEEKEQEAGDVASEKKEQEVGNATNEEEKQEVEDAANEDEEQEVIAQKMGMDKSSILSCEKVMLQKPVTRSETFEEIAGIKGKYKEIYVVAVNRQASENKKFEFVGINENGEAEEIPELTTRGATTTDKSVYAMNKDGSVVKEKQVTQLFNTGDPYKNFSITMGDYGRIEVEYLRKSLEENKWIGSPVETSKQERVQDNVKRNMDENFTSKSDITEEVEKTEHQVGGRDEKGELGSKETSLENIDTTEGNETYTNYDEEITLHDGTITTISQEAEKYGKSTEEYKQMIEGTKADCLSDKIELARQTYEVETENEPEKEQEEKDRGEREMLTPEEVAEQEAERQQIYNNMNNNM